MEGRSWRSASSRIGWSSIVVDLQHVKGFRNNGRRNVGANIGRAKPVSLGAWRLALGAWLSSQSFLSNTFLRSFLPSSTSTYDVRLITLFQAGRFRTRSMKDEVRQEPCFTISHGQGFMTSSYSKGRFFSLSKIFWDICSSLHSSRRHVSQESDRIF